MVNDLGNLLCGFKKNLDCIYISWMISNWAIGMKTCVKIMKNIVLLRVLISIKKCELARRNKDNKFN